MKIYKQHLKIFISIIVFIVFSSSIYGLEISKKNSTEISSSAFQTDENIMVNPAMIQHLRLLKQKQSQTIDKAESKNSVFPTEFERPDRHSWLPTNSPSFLKDLRNPIKPNSGQSSRNIIEILFNGSADTSYTIGDSLIITITFSDGEDSARIGAYLDNGDGVFSDSSDIWGFDKGDLMLVDNDIDDENPAIGIYEISFSVDPSMGGENMMPFILEGASIFFTATDGGGTSTSHLSINGMDSFYSISGAVLPATNNYIVIAIPSWAMGMDNNQGPSEVWVGVTDTSGSYSIHLQEPGEYILMATDLFDVTNPQLFSAFFFQIVNVVDTLTEVNIGLVEANSWVAGRILDQAGLPMADITVWAENGPTYTETITDDGGFYNLGVMTWNDPFGYGMMETMWTINVDDNDLWPDYMIPEDRNVFVNVGEATNIPEVTHFTLYANDTNITGTIEFPPDMDIGCFGIFTYHPGGQVMNWIYFCDDGIISPMNYTLPVSSFLDDLGNYWVGLWMDMGPENLISVPNGYQTFSGATDISFELVMANASLEGQVYSSWDQMPIDYAWVSVYNDSVEFGTHTGMEGYFSIPVLGDMWYNLDVYVEGFEPFYMDSIYIGIDENLWLDIPLDNGGSNFSGPELYVVEDVPNDQGNRVRLQWTAGNPGWWDYFTGYSVWRHVSGTDQPLWDFIRTVPWHGYGDYSTIVPTLGNATPMDTTWSIFIVTAHTEDPNFFLDSNPMLGFSVDNLHPSPPLGLQASLGDENNQVELSWRPVHVPDFDYFTIYRGLEPGFITEEAYDYTIDTLYIDSDVSTSETFYYRVSAMDFNGNESVPSNEVSASLLGTGSEVFIPQQFDLAQNYPNPFNPVTTISYDLPQASKVTLIIYDILGNQISILVNDVLPAGRYLQKLDASDFSSGIYFYRIEAEGCGQTRKMMILK